MKKILIALFAMLIVFMLALPCFAEIPLTEGVENEEVQAPAPAENIAPDEDYASRKTVAEIVQDYCMEHWDAFVVAGYLLYNIIPKIGGLARAKKQAQALKNAMDTYYGDEKSEKNVFAVQKSAAKAQELFMNDAGAILEKIQEAVAPIQEIIDQAKNAEAARADTANIAIAVESAVELMASQLNDLVLASPSVSVKKKAEIGEAWMQKTKEIHTLVGKVVNANDAENEMQVD